VSLVQAWLTVDPIINAFSDVQFAFAGRPVMAKHSALSMYRPAAVFLAQTLVDLPFNFIQVLFLDIIVYFLGGLQINAGLFFTFLLFSFTLTGAVTALFRTVGYGVSNYNDATKITGGAFTAFVVVSDLPDPVDSSILDMSSISRLCTPGYPKYVGSIQSTILLKH
jgi:ABC-type multidrug transport system permease subunit